MGSIFKAGSILKCSNALTFNLSSLTQFSFFWLAIGRYILELQCTYFKLKFIRSNWQNSHKFSRKSMQPVDHCELLFPRNNSHSKFKIAIKDVINCLNEVLNNLHKEK